MEVSSLTVRWDGGTPANPGGTRYQVRVSTFGYGEGIVGQSGYGANRYEWTFSNGISANTSYYAEVRAMNPEPYNVETEWTQIPVKYTLIEKPTVEWLMIGQSSITVKAVREGGEELSNPSSAFGNVTFTLIRPIGFTDYGYGTSEERTIENLLINTTYGIKVTARNNDGILNEGGEQGPYVRSTKIEIPSGIEIVEVTTGSIVVTAKE